MADETFKKLRVAFQKGLDKSLENGYAELEQEILDLGIKQKMPEYCSFIETNKEQFVCLLSNPYSIQSWSCFKWKNLKDSVKWDITNLPPEQIHGNIVLDHKKQPGEL